MKNKRSWMVGLVVAVLFVALLALVKVNYTRAPLGGFDRGLMTWAYGLQGNVALTGFMSGLTWFFGDSGGVATATIVLLVLYFPLSQRAGGIWLAGLVVVTTLINTGVKSWVGRVRPDVARVTGFTHQGGMSFASGHSLFATVLLGGLVLIYWRRMRSWRARSLWSALAILGMLTVMFSRVFVGVHYPSDTVGGLLEGLACLSLSWPILSWLTGKFDTNEKVRKS